MKTYQAHSAVLSITAIPTKSHNNLLILAMSVLFIGIFWFNSAFAELFCNAPKIPEDALSKGGNKVTICHFPPGNPENYQVITISTSALNTHCDHHDDVFASDGLCPPIPSATPITTSTTTTTSSTVNWQYLDGPNTWSCATGKPNKLTNINSKMPTETLERIKQNLPEGKANVGDAVGLAITTNINLKEEARISVAYLTEGAGYKNAMAYFSFKTEDLGILAKAELGHLSTDIYGKIAEKIIFPNFSNDVLSYGDAVDLGEFEGGTSIGFTLISDGWQASQCKVDNSQSDKSIFRTIKSLNTEVATNNLDMHAVLFADPEHELIFLAFEDLNRDNTNANSQGLVSDNDFNDVILAIRVTPFSAVENISRIQELGAYLPAGGKSGPANWTEQNMAMPETDASKTGTTNTSTTTVK